jgi:hypothetical protein
MHTREIWGWLSTIVARRYVVPATIINAQRITSAIKGYCNDALGSLYIIDLDWENRDHVTVLNLSVVY